MKTINDVFWLGGSPCCGKSSVAALLKQRSGIYYYKCDEHFDRHITEGCRRGFPTCSIIKRTDHEYIFMRTDAEVLQIPFDVYREEFGLILEDIDSLPRPLLIEGCALLPERLSSLGVPPSHVFFMVPTEPFFRQEYKRRTWAHDRLRETSNPVRAYENWMNRDVAFARLISEMAESSGYPCMWVDGGRTVTDTAAEVARHFGIGPAQT
jgi:hypothetical protein